MYVPWRLPVQFGRFVFLPHFVEIIRKWVALHLTPCHSFTSLFATETLSMFYSIYIRIRRFSKSSSWRVSGSKQDGDHERKSVYLLDRGVKLSQMLKKLCPCCFCFEQQPRVMYGFQFHMSYNNDLACESRLPLDLEANLHHVQ